MSPCTACGVENPAGAKFCMSCGAPQGAACPTCGAPAPAGAKFCVECGTALEPGAAPAPAPTRSPARAEMSEERRKATVLFADLSGYTAIAERLDPEATKSLIDYALDRLSREVAAHGGHVDKYIGDNVMAVFGAPVAHEDDPERAVRAGLAMQAAMGEINAEIGARASTRDVALALRVGINSGEVLAGRSGDQYTVIGDTVNVAARLQSAGERGAVTVGPSTRRLTASTVEYRELEPLTLKGKSNPISAWEAIGIVDPTDRARGSAAPLIGRDEELALLTSLFERVAREERPHLVTVFGAAGVGKSRLLGELAAGIRGLSAPAQVLIGRSPAYGTATTYAALADVIRERFGIAESEDPQLVLDKLREGIEGLPGSGEEADTARIAVQLARLLGVDGRGEASDDADPEQVRDQMFAATRLVLQLLAEEMPLVLGIEDIHWADEGLLDLIEHLAGWGRGPLLIVCLSRDELLERRPTWGGGRRNATTISLDPLSGEEASALVRTLLTNQGEATELADEVASRSGGNPLFAEEMVNRLGEEGSGGVEELPDSVHAVLAARLDALETDERQLLQAASIVGQTFREETVAGLTGGGAAGERIAALVDKDMLLPVGTSRLAGEREFAFKHALVREVAYSTLPRAIRAKRHLEVARLLEGRAGANRDSVAALLAEHLGRAATLAEQADFPEEALRQTRVEAARAFELAGDLAASLYSNAEALALYEKALSLPAGLEPGERDRVEESHGDTAFRSGHVDVAIESWQRALESRSAAGDLAGAGELHRKIGSGLWHKGDRSASIAHFQRGIDLLKDGEPCRELIELYEEAASLYLETGDNMLAIYAAEKAQRLADTLGQSSTASRAHLTFGRVFGRIGDLEQARKSLMRSVELARAASPGEAIQALLALGRHLEVAEADYPGAGTACRDALALADQLGDVPAQIELQATLGQLAVHSARWDEVGERGEVAARLAEREGLAGQLCLPLLLQGISAWRAADWEGADGALRRSQEIAVAGGRSEAAFSAFLWLGYCNRDRGLYGAACEALAKASEVCDRAGLVAQSAEATGARAAALSLDGRMDEARAAVEAIEKLLQRAAQPVGVAAAAEARGAAAADTEAAVDALREAVDLWEQADRPLNAIRARLLLAGALSETDPPGAAAVFDEAAAAAERLDVPHLAEAARAGHPQAPGG